MERVFERFTVSVLKINKLIQKIKAFEIREYGLKAVHVLCVYFLNCSSDGLTASELVRHTLEDKAAISRAVDYLGKEGYVSCDGSAQKRYKSPISLTPKGEEAGIFLAERVDCILAEASAGLTDEKRGVFYECLDLISANLQNICDGTVEKNGG